MNENGKISVWYSWPVIVLALCFFWPIGVFLIIKRVSIDRKTAMGAGKIIGGFGIASYCIAGIGLLACITDGFSSDDVLMILFFGVAGVILQKVSKKIKREADEVKRYLSIIINNNVRQLDAIASSTGKNYDVVKSDIQKLIDKDYLKNAYINEGTREIVLPDATVRNSGTIQGSVSSATVAPKIVACKCCGANNTIMGEIGECEFCGAPLK